jgi:hypothetical protein
MDRIKRSARTLACYALCRDLKRSRGAARRFISGDQQLRWDQRVPYSVHSELSTPPTTLIGIVIPGVYRNTNPHLGFAIVSLAVLAAYGLDFVERKRSSICLTRLRVALAVSGAIILLGVPGILTARKMSFDIEERVALAGFFALAAAALLGMKRTGRGLAACVLLLALVEIGNTSGYAFAHGGEPGRIGLLRPLRDDRDIVAFLRSRTDRGRVEIDMACTGMVVASENMFPGWRATVDGAPAGLHAAYTVLRGVVVPAGRHRVEMRYRPAWLYAGAVFSLLGVAAVLVLARWERRKEALRP